MSGLELITVLGVAASAAQIIDYSLKVMAEILEVYNRVKDAPNRVVRYTNHVHQIIATVQTIKDNQKLQNPLVYSQLQNTLEEVKHLHQVLGVIRIDYTTGSSSKRVWKAIVGDKERRMLTCFERLEKEKTSLLLCISVVHTQSLKTIGDGVDILVDREMETASQLAHKFKNSSKKRKVKNSVVTPMSTEKETVRVVPACNLGSRRDPVRSDLGSGGYKLGQPQQGGQTYSKMTSSDSASQVNGDYNTGMNTTHAYNGQLSQDHSFQLNGNHGSSGNHEHQNGHAKGNSMQINGNVGRGVTENEGRQNSGN